MGAPATFDLLRAAELVAEFQVKRAVTGIGRDPDNDVHVDDRMLSRFHARIEWRGTHYVVIDCGGQNGVVLNGARIDGEAAINAGDALTLGKYVLVMRADGPPPGGGVSDDEDTDPNFPLEAAPHSLDLGNAKGGGAHPANLAEIQDWIERDD